MPVPLVAGSRAPSWAGEWWPKALSDGNAKLVTDFTMLTWGPLSFTVYTTVAVIIKPPSPSLHCDAEGSSVFRALHSAASVLPTAFGAGPGGRRD